MPVDGSTTGVEVIPETGTMLPHGRVELCTGSPTCASHRIAPVEARSAYTVSFSVAVNTRVPTTSGSA
jgi:hypothetical protein